MLKLDMPARFSRELIPPIMNVKCKVLNVKFSFYMFETIVPTCS